MTSHEVIIKLIAATRNKTGLKVECQLDDNIYPKDIKVSDEELAEINMQRNSFHGKWNYTTCLKHIL